MYESMLYVCFLCVYSVWVSMYMLCVSLCVVYENILYVLRVYEHVYVVCVCVWCMKVCCVFFCVYMTCG